AYPDAIRLSCFQHCKRKFLNITGNKDAEKIVRIINRLYQNEHRIPPDWTACQILDYRNKYAPPILKELKEELINIKNKKSTLPKSELSKAINYTLNEYDALCNYIRSADYAPDNNAIERLMRYISLSRRNSLFCGSHQGAKRAALIYSLACSCRLNNINSFEYFKDLLTKLIDINPNTDHETIRNLLPHKWQR
ncbi:IS66 family transposase, partial [Bacteroides ovatus]